MLLLLSVFLVVSTQLCHAKEVTNPCEGFQAKFNVTSVVGPWHTAAVFLIKVHRHTPAVPCHIVEFSEIDQTGLQWLVRHGNISNNSSTSTSEASTPTHSLVIRQHYSGLHPHDVWSRAVDGSNGCFRQILATHEDNNTHVVEAVGSDHELWMQLHILDNDEIGKNASDKHGNLKTKTTKVVRDNTSSEETENVDEGPGRLLLQLLWGPHISAVLYTERPGVSEKELRPVVNFLKKLRGEQAPFNICKKILKPLKREDLHAH